MLDNSTVHGLWSLELPAEQNLIAWIALAYVLLSVALVSFQSSKLDVATARTLSSAFLLTAAALCIMGLLGYRARMRDVDGIYPKASGRGRRVVLYGACFLLVCLIMAVYSCILMRSA